MKVIFLRVLLFCLSALIFAQSLTGMWSNSQQFLLISPDSLLFVLKPFYGFYYEKSFVLPVKSVSQNGSEFLHIQWPHEKNPQIVPAVRIADSLFLDFYLRGSAFSQNTADLSETLTGYWRCGGDALHIGIDGPRYKNEVSSYYFTESEMYTIRYWPANVTYEEVEARVTDGDFSFTVDKFLTLGNAVFTCVTGRGTNVRNVKKQTYKLSGNTIVFSAEDESVPFIRSDDGNKLGFLPAYLTQSMVTDIDAEIAQHNAQKKPARKPPFDNYLNLDFRWEEIRTLRTDPFTGEVLGEFIFPEPQPILPLK